MADEDDGDISGIDDASTDDKDASVDRRADFLKFGPDRSPDSTWGCPCGRIGTYSSLVSHRKGYKNRPDCAKGRLFPVTGPSADAAAAVEAERLLTAAAAAADEAERLLPPKVKGWGYDDPHLLPEDPEELAALLMREIRNGHTNGNGHTPIDNSDLLVQGDFAGTVAPGEFTVEPGLPVVPSQYRETVYLSAKARIVYDWARAHGWKRGDGSISAFVLDVLTDHFENCWGMQVVVVEKADMELTNG